MNEILQIVLSVIFSFCALALFVYYWLLAIRLSKGKAERGKIRLLSIIVMFGFWFLLSLIWAVWDNQARRSLDILFVVALFLAFISGLDLGLYNLFRHKND